MTRSRWEYAASTMIFLAALFVMIAGIAVWRKEARGVAPVVPPTMTPSVFPVGSIEPNRLVKIPVSFVNRDSKRSVKLFGVEDGCDEIGCVTVQGIPAEIPPGGKITLEVSFKGMRPGTFRKDVVFFTDVPGHFSLTSTVTAEVVTPQSSSKKPTASLK